MKQTTFILNNNGISYNVLVTKKKIKSLRLKITADSKISLSIPYFYPFSKAYLFLESRVSWIEKNLNKFKLKTNDELCSFKNNSNIFIFGKKHTINLMQTKKELIKVENKILTLSLKQLNYDYVYKKFNKWAEKYLDNVVQQYLEFYFEKYFSHLKKPVIKYKKMKSMWGNCKYVKDVITLNLYLVKVPVECIEYVVLHELAHLIYHDHGKNFKNFLTSIMPDWKILKKNLNEYSLYF